LLPVTNRSVREPIQDRAQATRERLLDAALRCFAAVGYEAASTRRIEASAGVKRGLIAYHFGTKEALWKEAVTWWFGQASHMLRVRVSGHGGADPVAQLRALVTGFVRFSASFPEANRLMIREGMDDDWRLDWLADHIVRPWYERLRGAFEDARSAGAVRDVSFVHFYYALIGSGSLLFSMAPEAQRLAGVDPYDDDVVSSHAEFIADLLIPGNREREP
jgi:TetR/AcrR family transcriptional regulator